mmetsp:Transcript_46063/g.128005  ORF Transcript_46063/g.128005 Transcript_46063/m.128005 type:complete len:207 (+) Transcript_46063:2513-3133(+)
MINNGALLVRHLPRETQTVWEATGARQLGRHRWWNGRRKRSWFRPFPNACQVEPAHADVVDGVRDKPIQRCVPQIPRGSGRHNAECRPAPAQRAANLHFAGGHLRALWVGNFPLECELSRSAAGTFQSCGLVWHGGRAELPRLGPSPITGFVAAAGADFVGGVASQPGDGRLPPIASQPSRRFAGGEDNVAPGKYAPDLHVAGRHR